MTAKISLAKPPIIEAVLDIDCELPLQFDIRRLDTKASKLLAKSYPKKRPIYLQDHRIEKTLDNELKLSVEGKVLGFQFLKNDERQIVQFRSQGFSFNRLSPYSSLDNYLPQIKKLWMQYSGLVEPVRITSIRLRYINRILLPLTKGDVNLDDYIINGPRLADSSRLSLLGFLDQYSALDTVTGHQINSVLTVQPIVESSLPLIFDNGVISPKSGNADDWNWIRSTIDELRDLKNHIFQSTITNKCLNLFR